MGLLKGLVILLIPMILCGTQPSVYNIFNGAFTEPFEIMYLVCYDGTAFKFTTNEADTVGVSVDFMLDIIEDKGQKAKNISIIIHNHWGNPRFTNRDKKVYWYFYRKGFNGAFLLYVLPQHIIKELPESKRNRNR